MALYDSREEALDAYGEIYVHYKGGIYRALDTALHTEDQKEVMVYEHLWPNAYGMYVRPLDLFYGNVVVDGKLVRRFEPVER